MPSNNATTAETEPAPMPAQGYRGRIAPTPTGLLHMGHAHTFRMAWQRARSAGGTLIYRQEDLDPARCTPAFAQAAITDLRRYGLNWDEGPDCTPQGAHTPYCQSQRTGHYRAALLQLIRNGHAYPDTHSRSDLAHALESGASRPTPVLFGEQDSEAIFPTQWRPTDADWFANPLAREQAARTIESAAPAPHCNPADLLGKNTVTWRFRVPDGEAITFTDGSFGRQSFTADKDFGDFTLWRRDSVPAYELAVVVDDIAMGITEVVRGADLLRSTARQLLLYRALNAPEPAFFHCPLVLDPQTGNRLAKRADSLSLRTLLDQGLIEG